MWSVLQSPLGMKLTFVLLHFVWQATVIYCAWRLISRLASFRSPQMRYCGALATLLLILLCPGITFGLLDIRDMATLSRMEFLAEDSASPITLDSNNDRVASVAADETNTAHELLLATREDAAYSLSSLAYLMVQIQPYLMLIWTAGVVVLGLRLCIGYLGTVWLRRVGLFSIDSDLLVRYADLATRLNLLHLSPVAFSCRVSQAMTVGLLRPMVLLPAAWAAEIAPEILEAVLSHELAHIRRQDLWINFLQRVAETIFFYHPVVWWVSTEIRREREVCCDEMAIEALGHRLNYAKSLEHVASWQLDHANEVLATNFLGDRQGQLIGRIRQILGISTPQAGERSWPAGLVLMFIPLLLWAASAIFWPESASQANAKEVSDSASDMVEQEGFLPPRHLLPPHPHHPHPHHDRPLGHRRLPEHRHPLEFLLDDIEQALPADDEAQQQDAAGSDDQSVIEVLHELREEVRQLRLQVRELKDHQDRRPPPPLRRPLRDRPRPENNLGW
ncbi:Regulatory protein BlaR1 [Bremerella volcania]|uniref:Regulatory protein BlaR1 n=1 Tax=Bremerella volcania TaxID=2527984 RepID=A0A518CF99_9BACT|nr:M56 family metallopeptidase [Bremerella volcania]QDU77903.1 Regulatory protein BlaR1 [Bremerella volcania]